MSKNEIEENLNGLVNYMGRDSFLNMTGDEAHGLAVVGYKGIQNPYNPKSKMAKIVAMAQGREFDITITNANAGAEEIYLLPSMLVAENENGHPVSGKAISGNALAISSSSGPTTDLALKAFYRFLMRNPMIIVGMRISTSDTTQMSKTLLIKSNINPFFSNYSERKLNIQSYVDENNNLRDIATIDEQLPADDQTQLKLSVVPGTHTFTFFIGGMVNTAQLIRSQAIEASK